MHAVRAPELLGALDLLDRAVAYTRVAVAGVRPGLLGRPTPCAGWDLRALLRHMDDSLAALHEAGARARVSLTPDVPLDADLPTSLRARACALLGAWTRDGGADLVTVAGSPVSAALLAAAGALEITVHGWDVATACGRPHPVPDALAADLLGLVDLLVVPADRPCRFGPVLPVPPGAPAGVRLLASVGRQRSAATGLSDDVRVE